MLYVVIYIYLVVSNINADVKGVEKSFPHLNAGHESWNGELKKLKRPF